jgi:molybdopterin synthase catalytic subunit/molybdopterin synthase sulfur carrier subunit
MLLLDLDTTPAMNVEVRLFARARDLAGADRVRVRLPESARVSDLRVALAEQHAALRSVASSLLVALGTDYADDAAPITPSVEIACFPPVSGG